MTLPWVKWLKFKELDNPINTLTDLEKICVEDKIALTYLEFLKSLIDPLKANSLPQWKSVLALGPFTEMKQVRKTTPIIAVINYKSFFRHLEVLSSAITGSFLTFGILPSI